MADEFESGFVVQEPAWHGKAKVLDNPANAEEAIVQAGLDWNVSLRPITVAGVPVEDHWATVRDEPYTVLGIVGKRYSVVQNRDLFAFFDPVIDRDKNIYHTGGSLKEGKVVWLLAKLDRSFYVVDDDRVDSYILLASSHDGTMHITVKHTPIRVVCWNTLSAAVVGRQTTVQIRHTASAHTELRAAHNVLGISGKAMGQMEVLAQSLLAKSVSGRVLKKLVEHVFPSQRDKEKRPDNKHYAPIEMLFVNERNSMPGMAGTGWAAFNALTEYIDHTWPSQEVLYRSWFGSGESLRAKALSFLLKED